MFSFVTMLLRCNEVDLRLDKQDPTAVLTMEQLYDGEYDSFYMIPPYSRLDSVNFDASRVKRAVEDNAMNDSEVSLVFVKDSVATAYAMIGNLGTTPHTLVPFKGYAPTTRLRCVRGRSFGVGRR